MFVITPKDRIRERTWYVILFVYVIVNLWFICRAVAKWHYFALASDNVT